MFPHRPRFIDRDDDFLIIDLPAITMAHPMLDGRIKMEADQVLNNIDICGPRTKPFFAIVTGMGRGKTRTLLELSEEITSREKALSVAITFNSKWLLEEVEYSENLHPDKKVRYAISLVTRILSVYYRMPHSGVVQNVVQYLIKRSSQETADNIPKLLIRDCIRYIIRQNRINGVEIETFVLMLDESAKIEEKLKLNDIHNVLREALLDVPLFKGMPDQHAKVELVMSCLNISSTGVSLSSRPIIPITTPEVLTPDKVLDHWWLKETPIKLTAESRFKVLKLISTMNGLPRALQYGSFFFGKMAKNHLSSNAPWDISVEEITQLYESVRMQVALHYPLMKTLRLSPRLTKVLLFCEEIVVDDEVMDIISHGVFTNSLSNLISLCKTTIIPKTTIMTMDIMSDSSTSASVVSGKIREVIDNILKFIVSVDSQIGYPLEIVANGIINARLLSLADTLSGSHTTSFFTISQLLLLEDPATLALLHKNESNIVLSTMNFLTCELIMAYTDKRFLISSTSLSKSYDEIHPEIEGLRYLTDANDIIPSGVNVVTKTLDPDEAHDGVWSFRTLLVYMIYTFMIDAKSIRELPAAASHPPLDLKQATYMQSFDKKIETFTANNLLNVNEGSMTHSLALNNTIFVYITTRKEVSKISDRLLILGDTDTRKFLGFLEPLYAVSRTSSVVAVRDYNLLQKYIKSRRRKKRGNQILSF